MQNPRPTQVIINQQRHERISFPRSPGTRTELTRISFGLQNFHTELTMNVSPLISMSYHISPLQTISEQKEPPLKRHDSRHRIFKTAFLLVVH